MGTISGTVTKDGSPIEDVAVYLFEEREVIYSESVQADFEPGDLDDVVATASGLELDADISLYFGEDNAYVSVVHHADLQLINNFKIKFDFKAATLAQTNKYIMSKQNRPGIIWEYVNNTIEFFADGTGGYSGTNPRTDSGITINDTEWHTIVYEYNGSTWKGSRDGTEVFSVSRTFSLGTNTNNWIFGNSTTTGSKLNGNLRNIEIWKGGMLQGKWLFNEGSGTTAADSSGNSRNGTIANATWDRESFYHGNRIALPIDLTNFGTNPGLDLRWDSTEPTGTSITIETAVKGETAYTDENIGTGDGAEDTFYLPAYPAERHSDVVISVDGTPTVEFTRPNVNDPREIIFNAGHEPGDTLAVTADYTGVNVPSETAEAQTLYLGGATGGTFTLSDGTTTTSAIAYNATAATIETALEAIFGTDLVTVAVGTDFTITFSVRVRASGLVANFASLTGATLPTLTETTPYSAGDWAEQTSGVDITNIPEGDLTGKHLWIRQTLTTTDTSITPTLESLLINMFGYGNGLTHLETVKTDANGKYQFTDLSIHSAYLVLCAYRDAELNKYNALAMPFLTPHEPLIKVPIMIDIIDTIEEA